MYPIIMTSILALVKGTILSKKTFFYLFKLCNFSLRSRVIYITGTESEVSLAQSLVWEMIGQQTYDSDGTLNLIWEPSKAKDNPGEYDK